MIETYFYKRKSKLFSTYKALYGFTYKNYLFYLFEISMEVIILKD